MTSIEAYKKFELKANNINTAYGIDVGVGEFVLIYNEQQNTWTRSKFRGISKIYDINDIQVLVTPDVRIATGTDLGRFTSFDLPTDYIDYISSYALASKDACTERVLYTYQVKLNQIDMHLRDEFNKPSFEYHETPVTISQDNLQVYKTDFSVDSVFLTYYRYPKPIDIAGYTKVDGTASTTVDPELYDQAVDDIIDLCVSELKRAAQDTEGFQLSQTRINNNK